IHPDVPVDHTSGRNDKLPTLDASLEPPFFLFNHPATPQIYPLSLHDALPISHKQPSPSAARRELTARLSVIPTSVPAARASTTIDRKSTRLNSSHLGISYAVFCLKKKKTSRITTKYNNQNCIQ